MTKPSDTVVASDDRSLLRFGLALLAVVVLLYGVLVAQQILAAFALIIWLFVVYLAWRFVRAHERLADAAETVAAARADGNEDRNEDGNEDRNEDGNEDENRHG